MKIVPSQAKRLKTSLRKCSIKKHEITQNCPLLPSLPLPFPRTVIAFHRVKTSLLSIQRVRTVPYFLQIARFDIFYVCVVYFGGDRSGMDKSKVAKKISGRGRRSREKGNEGVEDFRFINILTILIFILSQLEYLT